MTVILRCTSKLPEPLPYSNPLGEWYADLDAWCRHPFVLLLNPATGVVLVLSADAAGLRRLQERALLQFAALCERYGLRGSAVEAELQGFHSGLTFAHARDRSLLGTLNRYRFETWIFFEHDGPDPEQAAARLWDGLYKHPALGRDPRHNSNYHRPLDLLRARLDAYGAIQSAAQTLH